MLNCNYYTEVTNEMINEYNKFFTKDNNFETNIDNFIKSELSKDVRNIQTIVLIISYINNVETRIDVPLYPDYKQCYLLERERKGGKKSKKSNKSKKAKKAKKSAKKTKRHR